jgi:hypothetical protein
VHTKAPPSLTDRVLASATQRNGLSELELRPPALALAAGGSILSPSLALAYYWHCKLIRASPTLFYRMARSVLVSGMPSSLTDVRSTLTCFTCPHGKQEHCPFAKHGAPDGSSVVDVVYSDTVESQVHSAGGDKHAGKFTDAKTRYTSIRGLAKKGDVAAVTRQVLAQWAVQHENTTKIYKTDGANEYKLGILAEWYANRDIIHQETVPYTPPSPPA